MVSPESDEVIVYNTEYALTSHTVLSVLQIEYRIDSFCCEQKKNNNKMISYKRDFF